MNKIKKIIISVFIVFNFLIMIRVHLPVKTNFFSKLYYPINSYLSYFSIYQDWMMFAPDPGKFNYYLTAKIDFSDGSNSEYLFPRASQMSFIEKYKNGEKFRKIVSSSIRKNEKSFLWPDTARFALRKTHYNPIEKKPVKIYLTRHWNRIAEVSKNFKLHQDKPTSFKSFTFYTHEVKNDKL